MKKKTITIPAKDLKEFNKGQLKTLKDMGFPMGVHKNKTAVRKNKTVPTKKATLRILVTKRQMKILKEGWKELQKDYDDFYDLVCSTEEWMSEKTGIKGIEFFKSDGDYVGIGNGDRTMGLIQRDKLEA